MKNIRPLTSEDLGFLLQKSEDILATKGVKVDHPTALKLLQKAGADVDFNAEIVKFPRDMTRAALRSVPPAARLSSRDDRPDMVLPDPDGLFFTRTNMGARSWIDPDTRAYRSIMLSDVAQWAQLADVLGQINACCHPTPQDVPEATADLHALKTLFENTSKHVILHLYSYESVGYALQMAQAVVGNLEQRPLVHAGAAAISPLAFKPLDIEIILQSCQYGIPVGVASLPSSGGTAPVTIAGEVMLACVEILAQLVMSQVIRPGIPVIGFPLLFMLDMASGRTLQSSIEVILAGAAMIQFHKEALHIPAHVYGFGSDSFVSDEQAGIQVTLRSLMVAMAGCDMLGGAGQLNVATAISPIQLMIDNEVTKIIKRAISGVKVDDETLAWREIMNVAPGGHFLESPHTLKHCREAMPISLFTNMPIETWVSEGKKDLYARTLDEFHELQKKMSPRPLPDDVQKELAKILSAADRQLVK